MRSSFRFEMRTVRKIRRIERPDSDVTVQNAPAVDPHLLERAWYVWVEGAEPIGPVSAHQLARGVRAGKVPSEALVRHERETFWSDLIDSSEIVAALKAVSLESQPPPPSLSPALTARHYMVWVEDGDPVGPVSADQIARGIRAGKVPAHANVQRVGELLAMDVLDEPDVIAALKLL